MLKKAVVYWIRYEDHSDPFTEGYIGVTVNPKGRFYSHERNTKRPQIFNRIKNGAKIEVIHEDVSEEFAYALEKLYRPISNVGWNIKPGGQHIERERKMGKTTKRTPITLFGITYVSVQAALKSLGISTSVYYFMKNNDCSMFSNVDEVKAHIWKERNKKIKIQNHSPEARARSLAGSVGAKRSDESRLKMSISQRKRFAKTLK
jgi:hypothetical protein